VSARTLDSVSRTRGFGILWQILGRYTGQAIIKRSAPLKFPARVGPEPLFDGLALRTLLSLFSLDLDFGRVAVDATAALCF